MGTNKLLHKLKEFLDQSKGKQRKKYDKLLKIIHKLEEKKSGIHKKMVAEIENDENSKKYIELDAELKTVNRLLKKARHLSNDLT